jgi:response regulator NasT
MTKKSILALVLSSSDTLQNGLLALMTTIPAISAVLVAEDIETALRMAENHQPTLIILDMSLPQVQDILRQIKVQWPHIHPIVLVEDTAQLNEVNEYGAESVLLKGFPPQKFVGLIESLLTQREKESQIEPGTKAEFQTNSEQEPLVD